VQELTAVARIAVSKTTVRVVGSFSRMMVSPLMVVVEGGCSNRLQFPSGPRWLRSLAPQVVVLIVTARFVWRHLQKKERLREASENMGKPAIVQRGIRLGLCSA